jgi:hypothetical protein
VHETERNRLLNELRRLKLAAADMALVAEEIDALSESDRRLIPRVLETGLVTVYARSFKSSGRHWPAFTELWTPTDPHELAVHNSILRRRDKQHAHTDEKHSGRDIVDVFGKHFYAEQYEVLAHAALEEIAALARAQRERFKAAADEIEYQLGRTRDTGRVYVTDFSLSLGEGSGGVSETAPSPEP